MVVVVAVGVFLFVRRPDPYVVLARSLTAVQNISTVHTEGTVDIGTDLTDAGLGDLKTYGFTGNAIDVVLTNTVDTVFNATSPAGGRTNQSLEVSIRSRGLTSTIVSVAGGITSVDGTLFAKLEHIVLPLPVNLSPMVGTWYRFSADEFRKKFAITLLTPLSDSEIRAAIFSAISRHPRMISPHVLSDEVVNNHAAYHYRLTWNPQEVRAFMLDARKSIALSAPALTSEEMKSMDEFISRLPTLTNEIWIGKTDFLPYRISIAWPFSVPAPMHQSKNIPVTITGKVNYTRYGEALTINPPSISKTGTSVIKEITLRVLAGLVGRRDLLPSSETRNSSSTVEAGIPSSQSVPFVTTPPNIFREDVDSDGDGLTDIQETFWGTDPHKPDTDGDGFTDRQEINSNHNPLGSGSLF